jgi:hypothetical protein
MQAMHLVKLRPGANISAFIVAINTDDTVVSDALLSFLTSRT